MKISRSTNKIEIRITMRSKKFHLSSKYSILNAKILSDISTTKMKRMHNSEIYRYIVEFG